MQNSRIRKIESLEKQVEPEKDTEILVYHRRADGNLERTLAGEIVETLTEEQFEALPGRKIHVTRRNMEAENADK